MADDLSRRDLWRVAVAAGLLGPALAGCGDEPAEPQAKSTAVSLGRDYLALGLMALSEAHKRGWARGHHGAAVIASYFFCQEQGLDARTARALRMQVEAFVRSRRSEFPPLDPGTGVASPSLIVERLDDHIAELRSGGHDAIYSALALRALKELPDYATPKVVDGVCRVLDNFVRTLPIVPDTDHNREHPLPPYRDAGDIAAATLAAMMRPWSHVKEVGTGVVVHWVTHADALITLEELGHRDVAKQGHAAHQQYVNVPWRPDDGADPDAETIEWRKPAYWESDAPRLPQKRTWFFGHSFKFPYSLLRLLRGTDDPTQRARYLARGSRLHLPFL